MAEKQPLDFLVKFNDFLEVLPKCINTYFEGFVKMGENLTQSYVDIVCKHAAWRINITVERVRQKLLKALNDQYGWFLKIIDTINLGKKVIQDPLGTIGSFFDTVTKPYTTAIYYIKTLMTEIPRLAKNLANITSSLPPEPPNPDINFDAFQLDIKTVSMGAILSSEGLPSPEEMFPEPIRPWNKKSFQASFESGTNVFAKKSETKKYTPKK